MQDRKNKIDIDVNTRNWWRDLSADDYDDLPALRFIISSLSVDVTRMSNELAAAKISSEQGRVVDVDWFKALNVVYTYAKDKRKEFILRIESLHRDTKTEEASEARRLNQRILETLTRIESCLVK